MRDEVVKFADRMEKKLSVNDHKRGWMKCSYGYLLRRLDNEVSELKSSLNEQRGAEWVANECADIANFAMMIADKRCNTSIPE